MEERIRKRLEKLVQARAAFAFSNFQRCTVRAFGLDFPTVEHAFQASKTLDVDERIAILSANSAGDAKRLGREVTLRPDWEGIKVSVMANLLRQKFAPGTQFAKLLIDTGDEQIVEWNTWHDQIWGRCVCSKHKGKGKNWLGVLIMERRDALTGKRK